MVGRGRGKGLWFLERSIGRLFVHSVVFLLLVMMMDAYLDFNEDINRRFVICHTAFDLLSSIR